jgi:hypothetical protein
LSSFSRFVASFSQGCALNSHGFYWFRRGRGSVAIGRDIFHIFSRSIGRHGIFEKVLIMASGDASVNPVIV